MQTCEIAGPWAHNSRCMIMTTTQPLHDHGTRMLATNPKVRRCLLDSHGTFGSCKANVVALSIYKKKRHYHPLRYADFQRYMNLIFQPRSVGPAKERRQAVLSQNSSHFADHHTAIRSRIILIPSSLPRPWSICSAVLLALSMRTPITWRVYSKLPVPSMYLTA